MPKRAKFRTPRDVQRLSKNPGMHFVGGVAGLALLVSEDATTASWILRKQYGGARRDVGHGPYPEVSLAAARERASEASEQIRNGIDPIALKREAQSKLAAAVGRQMRFDEAARGAHKVRESEFKNPKHAKQWIKTLETYAFPKLGAMQVADIERAHVMAVVEPIWHTKTETAKRVLGRIENTWDWAKVTLGLKGENPARWSGNLDELLPSPKKVKKVRHQPALPWDRMPEFMADLRTRQGTAALGLEFAILTAARSEQVRLATWGEIDLTAKLWTVRGRA